MRSLKNKVREEKMKTKGVAILGRALGIALAFFLLISGLHAQQVIENSDKPLSKNAGRMLPLQFVFRITDQSGKFYFKGIYSLKIAEDGTIFIYDKDQLLRFSAEGKFIKNLLKKGQGPGEISTANYLGDIKFSVGKKDLYVYDNWARKIVHFDWDGTLIEDFKLKRAFTDFLGRMDDQLVFIEQESIGPGMAQTSGFRDLKFTLFLTSLAGISEKEILFFPNQLYQQPRLIMSWAPFETVLDPKTGRLYVIHTSEYKIVQVDLREGRVARIFNRKYPRVDYAVREYEKDMIKKYDAPVKKYEYDIQAFFLNKENIWVITSTKDQKKGNLIDVFDAQGKYIDNFYISIPGVIAAVQDDCIYSTEQDKDGNMQVVKYKIAEK